MSSFKFRLQTGFTLLELVLVLFILAILTTTSLSFLENENGQLRYDETLNKLQLIRQALLKERTHQDRIFYSGFVSDNGLIPPNTDLDPLTENNTTWSDTGAGEEWITFGQILPFYYNPDGGGNEIQLDDTNNPEFNLFKGFRGPYLLSGRDGNNEFRDGWGQDFIIASANNNFDYTFDRDGASVPPDFSGTDITESLNEVDWTISPTALNITIENNTGATIVANAYEVAVAIFENDDVDTSTVPEDRWKTFHFTQDVAIPDGGTFVSASGSWNLNGVAITAADRVPVGEHIILLVDTSVTGANIDGVAEIDDSARFTVFASVSNQPEITLTVP